MFDRLEKEYPETYNLVINNQELLYAAVKEKYPVAYANYEAITRFINDIFEEGKKYDLSLYANYNIVDNLQSLMNAKDGVLKSNDIEYVKEEISKIPINQLETVRSHIKYGIKNIDGKLCYDYVEHLKRVLFVLDSVMNISNTTAPTFDEVVAPPSVLSNTLDPNDAQFVAKCEKFLTPQKIRTDVERIVFDDKGVFVTNKIRGAFFAGTVAEICELEYYETNKTKNAINPQAITVDKAVSLFKIQESHKLDVKKFVYWLNECKKRKEKFIWLRFDDESYNCNVNDLLLCVKTLDAINIEINKFMQGVVFSYGNGISNTDNFTFTTKNGKQIELEPSAVMFYDLKSNTMKSTDYTFNEAEYIFDSNAKKKAKRENNI